MSDSKGHGKDGEMPENEDDYLYYKWLAERERREKNSTHDSSLSVPLEVTLSCVGVFVFGLLVWVCWKIYDKKIRPRRAFQRRVRDLSRSDDSVKTDPGGDIDLRRGAPDSGAAAPGAQAAAQTTADAQTMKLTVPSVGGSSSSNVSSTSASRTEESQPNTPSVRRRTPAQDTGEESGEDGEDTTAV